MGALPVTVISPPDLRRRFALASTAEPLSRLGHDSRSELAALLARVRTFDELPGKWQAALLRAEGALGGGDVGDVAPAGGACCCGAPAAARGT